MNTDSRPDSDGSKKWSSMLVVGLGIFMVTLDMSSANVALPTLVEELSTDFATIQWVIVGYILVVTTMILGVARLGDMVVKKKLYNWGLVIFALGSLLCGLAPNVGWLIAFRIVQGIGSVAVQALGSAIIVEVFPPSERGRAMGIIGSTVSVGIASGPAIGGLIIGLIGWRWMFVLEAPVGLVTLLASIVFLPAIAPVRTGERFDIAGMLLLLGALMCFALGMTFGQNRGFSDDLVRLLLALSGIGLGVFLVAESKIHQPMVDLSLFRNTQFSLNLFMGLISFIVFGGMFILPFYLQLVMGYPTFQMGLMMMGTPVGMGIVAPLSGSLSDRFGTRAISVIGLLVLLGGVYSVGTLAVDTSVAGYLFRVVLVGVGMGIFQSPNNSGIMGAAPPERLGVASGLMALSRNLGTTIGLPVMGAICTTVVIASAQLTTVTNIAEAPAPALVDGINGTFQVATIILLVSTVIYVITLGLERRSTARAARPPINS